MFILMPQEDGEEEEEEEDIDSLVNFHKRKMASSSSSLYSSKVIWHLFSACSSVVKPIWTELIIILRTELR